LEQHGHEKWYSKLFRVVNSALCFAAAYLAINYLHQVILALTARIFKFDAFVYYHGVKFLLNGHRWDKQNVCIIFASAPFFVLLYGLFNLYLFSKLKRIKILLNLFFVWSFVISTSMFVSQSIIASLGYDQYLSPFYMDSSPIFAWLRFPGPLIYALNIPALIILLYFAVNTIKPFLTFAYSYTKVNKLGRRRKFFVETAIIPFIIGAVITAGVGFPLSGTFNSNNIFIHGVYLLVIALVLFVVWYALQYIEIMKDDVLKYTALQSANVFSVFSFIAIAIFIKLTWHGLYL
jgi:hypothetical protein